tara:strand:+ start:5133 stop:5735 length:603 start_codon:yes stop_codon:yes gene_type:complete
MITKAILESHPVSVLKKEIRKSNIKKYSGLKKAEIIEIMLKDENKGRFDHIKMAEKKERLPSTKKQVEFLEALEEEDRKKAAKLPERKGEKKAAKVTTFGPAKPPRGKSKAFKAVIKELDEKGKVYRKARKEFGKDDPLRSKEKKARKQRKLTLKGRKSAEEKLDIAHQKAMDKTPFNKTEHDRILNDGYKALIKKYKNI